MSDETLREAVERARKVLDGWEHDGPDGYEFHLLIRRVREALALPLDHDFRPVRGHSDDDECTHREDGTDATYCGRTAAEHRDGCPASVASEVAAVVQSVADGYCQHHGEGYGGCSDCSPQAEATIEAVLAAFHITAKGGA